MTRFVKDKEDYTVTGREIQNENFTVLWAMLFWDFLCLVKKHRT